MRAGTGRPWVEAVRAGRPPQPVVLVLGGFITSPPVYRNLVRQLRERGAADVVVGNVWTMDWLLAAWRGLGPIVTRSGRGLLAACARSETVSLGAPVLVVGHSAGGMSARLLTAPQPFAGRRLNASGRIGAIVTMGTPNAVPSTSKPWTTAAEAAAFANRVVPGPAFAPTTGYLALASTRVAGRREGTLDERRAWAVYRSLLPDGEPARLADETGEIAGDGLIPLASALLPGARALVWDDVDHGRTPGVRWYGSREVLDRWWPTAIDTWRSALDARVVAQHGRAEPAAEGGAATHPGVVSDPDVQASSREPRAGA